MKNKKIISILAMISVFAASFAGCTQNENTRQDVPNEPAVTSAEAGAASAEQTAETVSDVQNVTDAETQQDDNTDESVSETELEVCFGDYGDPFILHLYDNDIAAAIARHVGTADWRLPIYHYDDYDNWEAMQYYDIPSRYEIPSNAETFTSAKGGEVYYSEPNRIVLFYHDSEISSEYTKVGYFDYTDEFVSAVENNPVLDGWDTKMVLIKSAD